MKVDARNGQEHEGNEDGRKRLDKAPSSQEEPSRAICACDSFGLRTLFPAPFAAFGLLRTTPSALQGGYCVENPCGVLSSIPAEMQERVSNPGETRSRRDPPALSAAIRACLLGAFFIGPLCGAAGLVWHQETNYRWAELSVAPGGKPGFTLLSVQETGITFTNSLEEFQAASNRVLVNGSGVAVGDYDEDGLPDIYLASLNGRNTLYKNLGGWKFKDVTAEAGVAGGEQFYRGAVFADINGDGHLDLLLAVTGGGVRCFLNDGHGKFAESTKTVGTGSRYGSVTMALADIDGNGTLDLYVANNRTDDIRDRGQVDIQMVKGQLSIPPWLRDRLVIVEGQVLEYGEPDILYLNDGHGQFTSLSWTNGAFLDEEGHRLSRPPLDWGLTATFRDMNDDLAPDIYVCNDYWTPDRVWLNDGHGHFRAMERLALRKTSASSMGVDFADVDRDGLMDFFVVDMLSREPRLRKRQMPAQRAVASPMGEVDNRPQIMRNTLFRNQGDGTYAEVADFSHLAGSEWSWSPVFIDVDLDGYEDVLITTGHARDVQDLDAGAEIKTRQRSYGAYTNAVERQTAFTQDKMLNARLYPKLDTPIVAFHNLGHLQFEEVTAAWGTDQPGVHHSIAMGDFDQDGDLDFVVNNLGRVSAIYRNNSSAPRVAVRLKGLPPNTQGIGAKVKLLRGAIPEQGQEMIAGGRYMSGSEAMLVFAAGVAKAGMAIEVIWRNGKKSAIQGVNANRIYEVSE